MAIPLIFNTVLYGDTTGNSPRKIFLSNFPDTLEIAYSGIDLSLVEGTIADGGGNTGSDPLSENPEDLKPHGYSPCVDAGIAGYTCMHGSFFPAPGADINGTTRPQGEGIDMGAYDLVRCGVGIPEKTPPPGCYLARLTGNGIQSGETFIKR